MLAATRRNHNRRRIEKTTHQSPLDSTHFFPLFNHTIRIKITTTVLGSQSLIASLLLRSKLLNQRTFNHGLRIPKKTERTAKAFDRQVVKRRRGRQEKKNPEAEKFLHFHDLRHVATSRLVDKLQLHGLMKVTGHKGTRMLDRYYHTRAQDLDKKFG